MTEAGLPVIDYDHCKGCMLCVEECPTQALLVERETASGGQPIPALTAARAHSEADS